MSLWVTHIRNVKQLGGGGGGGVTEFVSEITLRSYKSAFVSDNGESVCLPKNNANEFMKCNFLVYQVDL